MPTIPDHGPRLRAPTGQSSGHSGIVLIAVVSLLLAIGLLGATLYAILAVDLRNVGYYHKAAAAFHNADAGSRHVYARIKSDLASGALTLSNTVETVNYGPPSGYTFDTVTNLTRMADGKSYAYAVTGRSGTSRAVVEVVIGRKKVFNLGFFGEEIVYLKPNIHIYSYYSSQITAPSAADSTGEAPAGTNIEMTGDNDAVDGVIYLGEDESGTPATYSHEFTSMADVYRVPRLDPDPLGVTNGFLASEFARVALTNDNALAVGGVLSGGVLTIKGNVTLVGGDYYVSEIDLGNNKLWSINATSGVVNVYLTGPAYTAPNSLISVNPPLPDNLRIFSNSTEPILFQPNSDFIGFIYAPLAEVTIKPNGDFRGSVHAYQLSVYPGGEVYVDMDFINGFTYGAGVEILSWKESGR